jgi:energy-coupling factor transport system ATP-binding protein
MSRSKVFMAGTTDEVFERASELVSVGLDIPEITRLMMLLKNRGLDIDLGAYTVDAALESVKKLFNENKNK